jgi:hypothetical protein
MFITLGYLYNQIHPVVLGVGGPSDRWNRMYYSKPVKLHRGVNNPIKFKIRNNNQKDVNVADSEFTLFVVDAVTNREILTRTLEIEDAARGVIGTTITENDLNSFDAVRYHYGIKMLDSDGTEYPIYVDDNYSAAGVMEVNSDAFPGPISAVEPTIGPFNDGVAYTSVITVTPSTNGNNTAAYYLSDFAGIITVQGHLEDSSTVFETDYIDIISRDYDGVTGVAKVNFVGLFSGIRFKIELTSGSVDRILYKF